jgi:unsaturated pyranuronate lyase
MPTLVGFGTFAALPEEQISEKISRRILSGDQGMIVWWSVGAGVHVEPHSHANEQIVWMLKGKMEFRLGSEQRFCAQGDVVVIPGGTEHEAWFREDTEVIDFLCASARRLPSRRQTRLHERRLNTSHPARCV